MYKINDYIMYKRDVCKIKSIKEKYMNNNDYYQISPLKDESLIINVPVNSYLIRPLISKKEANEIIKKIKEVNPLDIDEKSLENSYKELLSTSNELDLIKIIKTTYLRNKKRLDDGKKIGGKDDEYFKLAESLLYTELSVVLNMSINECKEYIIRKLED